MYTCARNDSLFENYFLKVMTRSNSEGNLNAQIRFEKINFQLVLDGFSKFFFKKTLTFFSGP